MAGDTPTPPKPPIDKAYSIASIKACIPTPLDLDKLNYNSWSSLFQRFCKTYEVHHHLAAPSTTATSTVDPLHDTNDSLVVMWIYATISPKLVEMIVDVDSTAHGVWNRLKDLFHDNKDARITQLDNEIRNMAIGNLSITDFFQQLKSKADRLANLESPVKDTSLVTYAINGVRSKYPDAARVIRLREKAPTFDELRSLMLLEESDMSNSSHGGGITKSECVKEMSGKLPFGLYEWLVMPFGLFNAPSTFMRLMNEVLRSFIGHFVVGYFDDILVYSKGMEEHAQHLRKVFEVLRNQKLYGKLEKCEFFSLKVVFLGRFVKNFRTIIAPLTECIKKSAFEWTQSSQKAFEQIKEHLYESHILALPDFNQLFKVECDASGVGIGAILLQNKCPIVYFSEKLDGSMKTIAPMTRNFMLSDTICELNEKKYECHNSTDLEINEVAESMEQEKDGLIKELEEDELQ
ncbi:WRKY family transcription factor [Tanacetum coccineum]|uniref:WRKY family transcription factor n=1 Tax=Tanacetum coccineum TaxID=301880 RepID=A0ABQ5AHF8_9ASTR